MGVKSWLDSLLLRASFEMAKKAVQVQTLPIVPNWVTASFLDPTWDWLSGHAYTKNSAVMACMQVLSFSFPEAPLAFYRNGEEQPKHPTRALLNRPSKAMSESELAIFTILYMAIGGMCFWHKVRDQRGRVIGLVPYHAGHMSIVPSPTEWVSHYHYKPGGGEGIDIPAEDIVCFKWPLVDPRQPWQSLPPLVSVAREVGADEEASRYLYALLKNDAVPRIVLRVPENSMLSEDDWRRLKAEWGSKYSGDNRGRTAVLTGGIEAQRLALNLKELEFEALHKLPETRIAAAFRVPPIVAGLNAGLGESTYSNYEQALRQFTQQTLVPLWSIVASEIQSDLDLNPYGDKVAHDLGRVQALQENENDKWERWGKAFERGAITMNQFLKAIGQQEVPGGDVYLWSGAVAPYRIVGGVPELAMAPPVVDAQVEMEPPTPPLLLEDSEMTTEQKVARLRELRKAKRKPLDAMALLNNASVIERAEELFGDATRAGKSLANGDSQHGDAV